MLLTCATFLSTLHSEPTNCLKVPYRVLHISWFPPLRTGWLRVGQPLCSVYISGLLISVLRLSFNLPHPVPVDGMGAELPR